jgi:hypothetical protein
MQKLNIRYGVAMTAANQFPGSWFSEVGTMMEEVL